MINFLANAGASLLQNTALFGVNVIVGGTISALITMTLMEHFEDTPEIQTLSCIVGIKRHDCPDYHAAMDQLKAEQEALRDSIKASETKRDMLEAQLAGLRAIEGAVDEITLFNNFPDPSSGTSITVGTVYKKFVDPAPQPDSYFCYINLEVGSAGENRNLQFYGPEGVIDVKDTSLKQAGLNQKALSFGKSVCKPFLIGGDA